MGGGVKKDGLFFFLSYPHSYSTPMNEHFAVEFWAISMFWVSLISLLFRHLGV